MKQNTSHDQGARPETVPGAKYDSGFGAYIGNDVFEFAEAQKIEPYLIEFIEFLFGSELERSVDSPAFDVAEVPFRGRYGYGLMLEFSYGPRCVPVVRSKGTVQPWSIDRSTKPQPMHSEVSTDEGFQTPDEHQLEALVEYMELMHVGEHWVYVSQFVAEILLDDLGVFVNLAEACNQFLALRENHHGPEPVASLTGTFDLEPDDKRYGTLPMTILVRQNGYFVLLGRVEEEPEHVGVSELLTLPEGCDITLN